MEVKENLAQLMSQKTTCLLFQVIAELVTGLQAFDLRREEKTLVSSVKVPEVTEKRRVHDAA